MMDKFFEQIESYYVKNGGKLPLPDVRVKDAQEFQIARGVRVEPESEKSEISLRITERSIQGFGSLEQNNCSVERVNGGVKAKLAIGSSSLSFETVVEARDDLTADGGVDNVVLGVSGANDEEKEWLESARKQREKLSGTENGLRMLAVYGKHNEVYEELFRKSTAMKELWKAGGITKDMAKDTYLSIENGGIINDKDKQYTSSDGKITRNYNGNALLQASFVASNTMLLGPNYDPFDPNYVVEQKYKDAANAAASFGEAVKTSTGNSQENVKPMTASDVYKSVDKGIPKADITEISRTLGDAKIRDIMKVMSDISKNLINGSVNGDVAKTADTGKELSAAAFSAEEIEHIRFSIESAMEDRKRAASRKKQTLASGRCTARLAPITVEVDISEGAVTVSGVDAQDFEIEMAKGAFGEMSGLVSKELSRMDFLKKRFLAEDIAEAMRKSITEAVMSAYESK
jgi:hypothetical protein